MADDAAPDPGVFGSMVVTGECEVIPAVEVANADEEERDR
jgi:hypothetical protein